MTEIKADIDRHESITEKEECLTESEIKELDCIKLLFGIFC